MLLGLASSGVHSNGFSLIRKVIPDLDEDFGGMPIGRVLLEPTRLYVKPILSLMKELEIRGMAHITGGGFFENIPRIFSSRAALSVVIQDPLRPGYKGHWKVPPIFSRIAYGIKNNELPFVCPGAAQKEGEEILRSDPDIKKLMFNTYNMGIGFVIALAPDNVQRAAAFLEEKGFPAWEIGSVEKPQASCVGLRFA